MEIQGTWSKDEDGYMEFDNGELQRLYEQVTDNYHRIYNRLLNELEDEEEAYHQALAAGYEMVTDYKTINGQEEFATTYYTPTHVADVWYAFDPYTEKRIYIRGYLRISSRAEA